MGLFTPAWKDKDDRKAMAYIEKCENQKKLARIVQESPDAKYNRRIAALNKLTDQNELYKIALECCNIGPGEDIIFSRLSDQKMLADVAWKAKDWRYRSDAVKRLTDQRVLEDLAQKSDSAQVRIGAVNKLENQEILSKIALGEKAEFVRAAAVTRLTAQDALATVALTDQDYKIRYAAVSKITDQEILLKIAKTDMDADIRKVAKEKITDREKKNAIALALKEMIFTEKGELLSDSEWTEIMKGITLEDLKGRPLNKKLVYRLYDYRESEFVYDALIQADNEKLLLELLSDVSATAYNRNSYTCKGAMKLLHGLYQRGAFQKVIETKRGELIRSHYDSMACMGHDDYGAIVFEP